MKGKVEFMIQIKKPVKRLKKMLCINIIIIITAFTLTSCANTPVEAVFSLTHEEHENYIKQIEYIIDAYYWDYDADTLVFSSYTVPDDVSMEIAVAELDMDISRYTNNTAVLGQSNLIHYNGDVAGVVNFVFVKDELVGAFYNGGYDNSIYSMKQRNPFIGDGEFAKYENWVEVVGDYNQIMGDFPVNGIGDYSYNSKYGNVFISINDNNIEFYNNQNNKMVNYEKLSYQNEEVIGATYVDMGGTQELAVLLRKTQGEDTVSRVVFYNENNTEIRQITLSDHNYTCIDSEDKYLFLFADYSVELYEYDGNNFQITNRGVLKNAVNNCHIVDIDNNGVKEFVLSDGKDIYIYQEDQMFLHSVWSTHLGMENLYTSIHSGDLNHDGVNEIYICDSTGTTIRYILTEQGLKSSNADILFGQMMFPFDFNGDGITDYLNVISNESLEGVYYISK